jgi:hypothetical protein
MHRKLITLSATLATHLIPGKVMVNGKTVPASIFDIEAVVVGHRRELVGKAMVGGKVYSVRAGGFGEAWRVEMATGEKTK